MPGREEKRTLIIAEFKDYVFCATHQSLTPEDQLLAVPLIEKALQNVDKPIFMAGDMNSAPASAPSWNWQNILPPSMTQPLILSRQTVPTDV